jgi:hypothetical protein
VHEELAEWVHGAALNETSETVAVGAELVPSEVTGLVPAYRPLLLIVAMGPDTFP